MVEDFRALITNDWQFPYHDPKAVDVMVQIGRAFKPDVLDLNGDTYDFLNLSRFPSVKTEFTEKVAIEFESEIERGHAYVKKVVAEIKPKRIKWKNGNHEWRLMRTISNAPRDVKQILELKVMRDAYSYPKLLKLEELGVPVHFVGEYPMGAWLHPDLPPDKNVWVEHGYTARKKSGYTCTALMEDRMSSVICGHCEKLAGPLWRQVNGRTFWAVENGNLSILGIPGMGDGLYQGAPHSVPQYMNHTQGFTLATYSNGEWHPQVIRIVNGKAMWGSKLYTSRV